MELFQSTIDRLASPLVLYTAALVGIALASRTRFLLSRWGGVALLILALAVFATGLRDVGFRDLVLDPARLPVLLWFFLSLVFLWVALHLAHDPAKSDRDSEASASRESSGAEASILVLAGVATMACAYFLEPPLGGAKTSWFLDGFQEMRLYFDPWMATVGLPALFFLALLALPYLDAGIVESDVIRDRRRLMTFAAACVLLVLLPVLIAVFLRDPQGNIYGPFELRDPARPQPIPANPLSEVFWCRGLGMAAPPSAWWLRELPGVALLAGYFVFLPWWLCRWSATRKALERYRQAVGPWRFVVALILALSLVLVPIKMYGSWLLGIGQWLSFPELSFGF